MRFDALLRRSGLFLVIALTLAPRAAPAAVATWDGDGGDGLWSNPANWAGDVLPAAADVIAIPGGLGVVHVDAAAAAAVDNELDVGAGTTLRVDAGATLTVGGQLTTAGALVNAGTLARGAALGTVSCSGWVSSVTNEAGATLSGVRVSVSVGFAPASFVNHGTVDGAVVEANYQATITNDGLIRNTRIVVTTATFWPPTTGYAVGTNLAGGRIEGGTIAAGGERTPYASYVGRFRNEGTIDGATVDVYYRLENAGTIDLRTGGAVNLHCDLASEFAAEYENTGTVHGEVGTQCFAWDGGGDGVRWSDPLNWNVDRVPVSAFYPVLTSVLIKGAPGATTEVHLDADFSVGSFGGSLRVSGESASNPATLVVDAGATLTLAEPTAEIRLLDAHLVNLGTLVNAAGGVNDDIASGLFGSRPSTVENHGTFVNASRYVNGAGSVLENHGILTNTGTIQNEGTFTNAGALANPGAVTNTCASVFTNTGTVTGNPIDSPCAVWDGGGGDGLWSNPLNWSNDALPRADSEIVIPGGLGVVRVDAAAAAAVDNKLDVGAGTTLRVDAGATLTVGGQLTTAGALVNAGTLARGAALGTVSCSGWVSSVTNEAGATLSGVRVSVSVGFAPASFVNHGTVDGAVVEANYQATITNDGLVRNTRIVVTTATFWPPTTGYAVGTNLAGGRIEGGTITVGGETTPWASYVGGFRNEGTIQATAIDVYHRLENVGTIDLGGGGSLMLRCDLQKEFSAELRNTGTILGDVAAQCYVWDGGGDGVRWSDPLNWNVDRVPVSSFYPVWTTVLVKGAPGATTEVHLDADFSVGSFGGSLRVSGESASNPATLVVDAGATLTLAEPTAEIVLLDAHVVNLGTLVTAAGGSLVASGRFGTRPSTVENHGTLVNGSRYLNGAGSVLDNRGTFTSTGTIENDGTILNACGATFTGAVTGASVVQQPCDVAPPVIDATRTPPPNAAGWNASDVTVTFTCSDAGSGLAPGSPPPSTVLTGEGADLSVTGRCTDVAGNVATLTVSGVRIDRTAPVVTGTVDRAPDHAGWYTAPVTVAWTGTDALSGIASCAAPTVLSTDGASLVASGSCADAAGNAASATVSGIRIDRTPPVLSTAGDVTVEATSPAGTPVPFAVSALDAVAGPVPVSCTPAPGSAFPLGSTAVQCLAEDPAGNRAATVLSVTTVDTTPPALPTLPDIVADATGPDGAVVTWTAPLATDAADASPSVSCTPASGSPFPPGTTAVSCVATDASGNLAWGGFSVVVRDGTAPRVAVPAAIQATASSASGAVVRFGATATDDVDGALVPTCSPSSGSTFAPGVTHVTCTATDRAGNQGAAAFDVTVTFAWSGLLWPVKADGSAAFPLGLPVPVRFALSGASAGIRDLPARLRIAKVTNGVAGPAQDATGLLADGNRFRYDPLLRQYGFALLTCRLSRGTWLLLVDLGDGVQRPTRITLR